MASYKTTIPAARTRATAAACYVPRDDVNGVGPQTEENIASGLDRTLAPGLWPSLVGCGAISAGGNCNVVETNTGVNAAALGQGFRRRLQDTAGATQTFTYSGNQYNADTPAQVLGGAPTTITTAFGGARSARLGGVDPWRLGQRGCQQSLLLE